MILSSCCRVGMPSWIRLQQARIFTVVNPCVNQIQRLGQYHLKSKSIIANCRQYSKQLEISHPRQYKLHQKQRINDNLSEDWQLIFAPNRGLKTNWKIVFAYWASFLGLCCLPVVAVYGWIEAELEERVLVFGIEMSSQTQFLLFIIINVVIISNLYRFFKCIPRRIYYNEKSDRYLAINYHYLPWKLTRKEFKSSDICDYTGRKFLFRFNPGGHNEYKINNTTFIFPLGSFRSGHDRDWMLRHRNRSQREQ